MRYRDGTIALAAILAMMMGGAAPADAQTSVRVRATVGWDSGRIGIDYRTGDHRPYYDARRPVYYPDYGPRYEERVRGIRVPPGHRPRAGMCRAWFPGTPPGQQPPARPCGDFYRWGVPYGAVLLGPGGHPGLGRGKGGPPAYAGPPGHAGPRGKAKGRKGGRGRGHGPGR